MAAWSVLEIGTIVREGKQVISANKLRAEMLQREVDHLNWANAVLAHLAENRTGALSVQMDPRKCAFGERYYGKGRENAEALLPQIKPLMADIEAPHSRLETVDTGGGRDGAAASGGGAGSGSPAGLRYPNGV